MTEEQLQRIMEVRTRIKELKWSIHQVQLLKFELAPEVKVPEEISGRFKTDLISHLEIELAELEKEFATL